MPSRKLLHGYLILLITLISMSCTTAFVGPQRSIRSAPLSVSTLDSKKTFMSEIHQRDEVSRRRNHAGITSLQASSSKNQDSKSTTTSTIEKDEKEEQKECKKEQKEQKEENEQDINPINSNQSDFDTILQTRRTINNFLPDLPKDWEETLQKAIESAIYAPNHKRTEPWRFHLLGSKSIRNVCELNASIVTKKKGEKAGKKKLERWLQMPGWLVVTCKTDSEEKDKISMEDPAGLEREDYAACCCAVQNLSLSLHNAGMGTKWTTGPVNFDSRFGDIVGLEKNEYVVGTMWFGTPENVPDVPKKKRSVKNVFIKHD